MGRQIIAVVAGVIAAGVVVYLMEMLSHGIFPPPASMDPMDPQSIKAHLDQLPAGAFLLVLLGWGLGSFTGGFTAAKIAGTRTLRAAVIVGVIQMLGGILNMTLIPHPLWMVVAGLLIFVPMAWLGGKIAGSPAG